MNTLLKYSCFNQQNNPAIFSPLFRHKRECADVSENCCLDRPEYPHFWTKGWLQESIVDSKGKSEFFYRYIIISFCLFFPVIVNQKTQTSQEKWEEREGGMTFLV